MFWRILYQSYAFPDTEISYVPACFPLGQDWWCFHHVSFTFYLSLTWLVPAAFWAVDFWCFLHVLCWHLTCSCSILSCGFLMFPPRFICQGHMTCSCKILSCGFLMFPSDFMYMSDLFLQYYFLLQIYVSFTLHACAMTLLVPVQIYTEDVICKTHNPFDSYCRYNASCTLVCTCTAVISLVPTAKSLGTRLSCSVYTYVSKYTTTTAWTYIDNIL